MLTFVRKVIEMNQKNNKNNTAINSHIAAKSSVASRKYYDADFKKQVIEVWNSGVYKTVVECANSYGIKESTLHTWLSRLNDSMESTISPEFVSLKKENARLRMELEILKKATLYFASLAR